MDTVHIRPTWLTALFPLLAVWQYGDRSVVRAELLRMALSADAAARSAEALNRIANMLDGDSHAIEMHRDELRAIARAALSEFDRVPPRAPLPASSDADLYHAFPPKPADTPGRSHHA
ncbi:hypothetical protein [Paraburkholderia ginsengiterrae]|uniref:hypothetical protein n=1 Tax=Paraburkholderia ginsengiterrae TaxID=1462993 RepID=UPI000AB957D9|nr:hypothetical protein [Paraburkholderia ginsengiterrae]